MSAAYFDKSKSAMPDSNGFSQLTRFEFVKKWGATLLVCRRSNPRTLPINSIEFIKAVLTRRVHHPVFIIGSPRSGTTMLGKMLNRVDSISYYREPKIGKYFVKLVYERSVTPTQARYFYRFTYGSLLKIAARSGSVFVEKNPANVMIGHDLLAIFPDARFVHIYRDGRDVACSLLRKPWHLRSPSTVDSSLNLNKAPDTGYLPGPYPHFYIESERREEFFNTTDVHRCIWIWRRHVEAGRALKEDAPAGAFFSVKYEDLVHDPERTMRDLLAYIGINDNDAVAQAMLEAEGLHGKSIGRWREELTEEDLQWIYREAGDALRSYTYVQ